MRYKIYTGIDYNGLKRIEYEESLYNETNDLLEAKNEFNKLCNDANANCKKNKNYCYYVYVTESYTKDYRKTILAKRFEFEKVVEELKLI